MEWKWWPVLLDDAVNVKGKVENRSEKDYRAVTITFVLRAKDGDKMGETTAYIGVLPKGAKASFGSSIFYRGSGDKPSKAQIVRISAY